MQAFGPLQSLSVRQSTPVQKRQLGKEPCIWALTWRDRTCRGSQEILCVPC